MAKRYKLPSWPLPENTCQNNFEFWMGRFRQDGSDQLNELLIRSNNVLPTHTFPYRFQGFSSLKSIFGYSERSGLFSRNCDGIKAKKLRLGSKIPNFGHMETSDEMGHNIFNFAYLGVHNPHHRQNDDPPIRPFGVFLRREIEVYHQCHGAPCDVAKQNELVEVENLDKYYLFSKDMRELKAHQIAADNLDFWRYFGDPKLWEKEPGYPENLYKIMGEFRYFERIRPGDMAAILWPFFTKDVDENGNADMNENLDLYNSFTKTFPEIKLIRYRHDDADQQNWELTLVEASFYCTKYYLDNGFTFPDDADFAKEIYF